MLTAGVLGQDFPERPNPPRLVNDFAGVLDQSTVQQLENQLITFARETSTQIAVVTISDLGDYDAGDYAFQLAEKWGIGQSDKDNGALILVQPKTASARGQAFIATGYGLEGVVPDAVANRIVDNEMIPRFKQNDYPGGIMAASNVLMELTRGEYTADKYMERSGGTQSSAGSIIVIIFITILFVSAFFRGQKKRHSSLGHDLPFLMLLSMMGSGGRSHSGSFGNFSSGSGSFGGFGGGGFGGGGAGGSW